MEKGNSLTVTSIANSLSELELIHRLTSKPFAPPIPLPQFTRKLAEKRKPASLLNLCLGFVGKHLEDLIPDLPQIASNFPADIKLVIVAIARRRKLLNDEIVVSLADGSWEILDVSDSNVSDVGLVKVAGICKSLRAADISRCNGVSTAGISELVRHCRLLETLRCGGCPRSDNATRSSLGVFKPKLNDVDSDSWEELDAAEIVNGVESLRWLVWPRIDKDTLESFATECPRIIVNPKPSPFDFGGTKVPREALPDVSLDDPVVEDIDPATWAVRGCMPKSATNPHEPSSSPELSIAEKFRLAFVERDMRLATKRAKNARQHQRRAGREWVMMDEKAKALDLASKASKSLHGRS